MKENKLIQQLKLLNAEEFKQFYPFLRSTYFTNCKNVVKMFDWLRKFYPDFEAKQLNKATLFQKLFPKQPYSDIKLRNLFSKLNKILESYLIQKYYEQHAYEKKKILTQIYGQRNFLEGFKKGTNQLLKELEIQPYRDAEFAFERYRLQRDLYFHKATIQDISTADALNLTLKDLANFFAIERLYLGIDLKNRERIFSEKNHFVYNNYSYQPPVDNIIYQLFFLAHRLLAEEQQADFKQLKNLFLTHNHSIRLKDSETIFYLLLNYCSQRINKESVIFLRELFDLQKFGITSEIVEMNEVLFLNVIISSTALKEFDWANQIIQKYTAPSVNLIPLPVQQLSLGYFHFNKGAYEQVIEELKVFQDTYILYAFSSKFLTLRSLYKLFQKDDSYYDSLLAYMDAFERYLKRNTTLIAKKKEGYFNFILLLRLIVSLKIENRPIQFETLLSQINTPSNVIGIYWLRNNL